MLQIGYKRKAAPFMRSKNNNRILLVDDNPTIHEDFRKLLTTNKHNEEYIDLLKSQVFGSHTQPKTAAFQYEIDSAYQGEEALELVKKSLKEKKPYAMAFVDVVMPPGWDGVETIKKIWQVDPQIQIAICTAYSEYEWKEIINVLGASDSLLILKKPFDNIEIKQIACCLIKKWNLNKEVDTYFSIVIDRLVELAENNQSLAACIEQLKKESK